MQDDLYKILELVPICVWIGDASEIKNYLEELKSGNSISLEKYFQKNFAEVKKCALKIKILRINQKAKDFHQVRNERELFNLLIDRLSTSIYYETFIKQLSAIAKGELSFSNDFTKTKENGEILSVHFNWIAEDETYQKILFTLIDNSKQKKYEKALISSEKRFRKITLSANDAIIMIDKNCEITFWNDAAELIFGYKNEEILGKNIRKLIVNTADHEKLKEHFQNKLKDRAAQINRTFEIKARKKDKTKFPVEVSINSLEFQDDWYALAIVRDITIRKKQEIELRRHKSEISAINRILRHDLMNNLSSIQSLVDLYREDRHDDRLDKIINYIDRSSDLISKMREHEKMITSKNLSVYETKNIFRYLQKNYQNIEINAQGNEKVFADEAIYSVFDNLINNAVVHGKTSRIDLNATIKNDLCEIEVKDFGKGIRQNVENLIFTKGFTTNSSQHSGMGLHIVDSALDRWGGFVLVDENQPHGAIFRLFLNKVR